MARQTDEIVPLDTLRLQEQAAALYRLVFAYSAPSHAISPRLLRGLLANGGSAHGALDATGQLVGFCYGYTGLDHGTIYHYSQATAIAPSAQGHGLGRRLKLAQATAARATGATTMRWAFDPALARNAHFNLTTLAACGRWFYPDYYGEPESDRMIVEWQIDDDPAALPAARSVARAHQLRSHGPAIEQLQYGHREDFSWVHLPGAVPTDRPERLRVRAVIADVCARALALGQVAVDCTRLPAGIGPAVLLFETDSE
ncbi:GNAT family N-acetyltransferase [Cryobacterium aureum]|uniref:GNAT family N-acetyltransferase n=1 Tax=Cryobacterium aureum TaxID=995037 RepID=UPI000CF3A74C|nr:GNAT family N-acetyltransferase [Cryobacterium aureum]